MRKKLLLAVCVAMLISAIVFGGSGCASTTPQGAVPSTQQVEEYALYANPFGTSTYIVGFAFEDICRKYSPTFKIRATECPGGVYTLNLLEKVHGTEAAKTHLQSAGGIQITLAQQGITIPGEKKWLGFPRVLINYTASAQAFATLNPNIKTIDDLAGKRVALGTKGQTGYAIIPTSYLEDGAGLAGKIDYQYVGTAACIRAVADGLADACIVDIALKVEGGKATAAWPGQGLSELEGTGKSVRVLSSKKEYIERQNQTTGLNFDTVVVPKGALPFIDQPIELPQIIYGWGGDEALREDIAYAFTKTYLDNMDKFQEYTALGQCFTVETLTMGNKPEWFHPGAIRAYTDYAKEHPQAAPYLKSFGLVK